MKHFFSLLLALAFLSGPSQAASSFDHTTDILTARLITSEDGIAPNASTLSAGLVIDLEEGWKTYWKSPGQVGYPPTINWEGSENVASVDFQWPAPKRFVAFDIENYGYEGRVTHPVQITLTNPGEAAILRASVSILVCADVCVPQDFDLSLSVYEGAGLDRGSAELIAEAAAKVPVAGPASGLTITSATLSPDRDRLTVSFTSDAAFDTPQVFVDMGLDTAFGPPDVSISGALATVSLPVLTIPDITPAAEITIVNGAQSGVLSPVLTTGSAAPAGTSLGWTLLLAFIGGLILNIMPCVLPVLSIKFASALKSADQTIVRIRTGFLVSALGVLSFMWVLAAILITLRATGGQVGWGIQFQSPVFLALMVTIMAVFAANLAGLFEITLPQNWTTGMARTETRSGYVGDFATGALAAVMATPCSAPFLGTAVTLALAGTNLDTLAIFTALGAGLALPYALVALRPSVIQKLPKPGAWMNTLRLVLSVMMAATGIWLLTVLASVIGTWGAVFVLVAALIAIAGLTFGTSSGMKLAAMAIPVAAMINAPHFTPAPVSMAKDTIWTTFDESLIQGHVSNGGVVFVDVTAAWCLTCKANKSLVLQGEDVMAQLTAEHVTTMQADWTRPNPDILSYLQANGRFGIPFNIVYGPGAPEGVALPEILTRSTVLEAFEKAKG